MRAVLNECGEAFWPLKIEEYIYLVFAGFRCSLFIENMLFNILNMLERIFYYEKVAIFFFGQARSGEDEVVKKKIISMIFRKYF